jgi:protein involved in polysaccharide export with SLBB domain
MKTVFPLVSRSFCWLAFAIFGLLAISAAGQQSSSYYDRKTAVNLPISRAEQEADQIVSLAPDTIISILRKEVGLMLQVKKAVVRKAFDQGRILNPAEISDDSLFTMIREDDSIRVVVTKEIVDRAYVRAKPTQEELRRTPPCPPMVTPQAITGAGGDPDTKRTQEENYWRKHEADRDCYFYQNGASTAGAATQTPSSAPTAPMSPEALQSQYADAMRRQVQSSQMQRDEFDKMQSAGDMPGLGAGMLPGMTDSGGAGGLGSLGSSKPSGDDSGAGSISGLGSGMSGSDVSSLSAMLGGGGAGAGNIPFPPDASTAEKVHLTPPYFPSTSAQPQLQHRPNPYADVPSLYDMYAQYQMHSPKVERFGQDIFRNGTGNLEELPMDLPVGPDYVVGPGDGLVINLTGSISKRLKVLVDREGRVALPEVGAIEVSGKPLAEVQQIVQKNLRSQYRDVQADISIGRLRTVRVYVVGDVERPGAYDISSLSTPLNAVYAAGGPTSEGSLRLVRHYRGKQLLQEVDVYDLLLHGIRGDLLRIEAGDTVQIPPLGPEVTVEGMVRRPAIYELHGEKTLAEVLQLAGGVLPTGTFRHIDVDRLEAHVARTMLRIDIPESNNQASVNTVLENFVVQSGDKIKITPILPFADKTVYLDGHVSRPGKFAYRDGMKVSDLIKSYNDLLPEPYKSHAEIIRLREPDHAPEILAFNLEGAMSGTAQDLILKPFDTVRIFGRFDFEDQPLVTVTGEVRDPGDHVTNGQTSLRDAIYLAGGLTPDALMDDAQVFRRTPESKMEVVSVNLAKALGGDDTQNIALGNRDRVFVHKNLAHTDPPTVQISGEVARPGKYSLGENMTAVTLLKLAGGFKRGAYRQEGDLTRYEVEDGNKMVSDRVTVRLEDALSNVGDADVRLRDGDVLAIRQLTGWKDVGATIEISGEVVHPGTYGIQEGERLSSIVQRAGGFRKDAYPYGAVFERQQIRELEAKNRADLIDRVENLAGDIKAIPELNTQDFVAKQAAVQQYQETLRKLQTVPPQGRMVLHISSNTKHWANTSSNLQVRAGDTLYVPKRPGVVVVDGSVYNPTGITYKPGKNARWYLRQAGGPSETADKRGIFVIRADGSVAGGAGGLFTGGVESASMQPGDMVVVPEKPFKISRAWENTAIAAQIATALGIAVEAARTF